MAFTEGSDVKKGRLLFVIQPDMYDAQLKSAQAAEAKAQATLNTARMRPPGSPLLVCREATSFMQPSRPTAPQGTREAASGSGRERAT